MIEKVNCVSSRRRFLQNVLPAGTLFCLGCSNLMALAGKGGSAATPAQKNRFLEDSGLTTEQVFQFAFRDNLIPLMQAMAKDVGREKLIAQLEKASAEMTTQFMAGMVEEMPNRDFGAFKAFVGEFVKSFPYNKALVYEITKDTDTEYEAKYTECLFAKVFMEADAADIGHAVMCYPSDAMIQAFNPKIKFTSVKNLLKGDDACIERFVWTG